MGGVDNVSQATETMVAHRVKNLSQMFAQYRRTCMSDRLKIELICGSMNRLGFGTCGPQGGWCVGYVGVNNYSIFHTNQTH